MARGAVRALLCVATAGAAAARLKADTTLYKRPSTTSESVAQVTAGTRVEVLSASAGWHEVKTPSGQGFVRSEALVLGELAQPAPKPPEKKAEKPATAEKSAATEKPTPAAAERPAPRAEPERVSADEFRQLTEEVRLLRERPEPATAADLERVERSLTQAMAGLGERPATASDPPLPDTSLESVLAVSPVLLLVGGVVGWVASRMTQRRRDNRNRIRV